MHAPFVAPMRIGYQQRLLKEFSDKQQKQKADSVTAQRAIAKERDVLQAEVERLKSELEQAEKYGGHHRHHHHH